MAGKSKSLLIPIIADPEKAKKGLKDLDAALGRTEKSSEKFAATLKGKIASAGIGAMLFGSLRQADESLKIAHQTEAVIRSTGGAANVTADHVGKLATSISNATGMDDEMIQSGENMLATFKNIRNEAGKGNDIFDQSTKIMVDFAAATGTDAKDAAVTLGKALNDPITGLTALRRVGVTFTQQQKDQIRTLQESGDLMGAQKVILKELTSEFGGSAAAQASSLDKIQTQVGNMAETIGTDLMPAVDVAAKGVEVLAEGLGMLPGPVVTTGAVVIGGAAAWTIFGSTVMGTIGTLGDMVGALATYTPSAIVARGATAGLAEAFAAEAAAADGAATATAGAGASSTSSMMGLGKQAGITAVGLLGVGLAANAIGDRLHDAVPDTESMTTALTHLAKTGKEAGAVEDAGGVDKLVERMKRFQSESHGFNKAANGVVDGIVRIGTLGTRGGHSGMDNLTKQINAYDRTLAAMVASGHGKEAAADVKLIRTEAEKQGLTSKQVSGMLNDYGKAVEDAKLKNADAKTPTDALTAAVDAQKKKADDAKKAFDNYTSAISSWKDATTAGLSSDIAWEAAIDSLTESLQTNGDQWDINTEAGRNNMNALIGAKNAAIEDAQAYLEHGGSVVDATNKMDAFRQRLEDTMSQAGLTQDQIGFLIGQMGLTPAQIQTTFLTNAPAAKRDVDSFHAALDALPTTKQVAVMEVFSGSSSFFGGMPGEAWGGTLPGHAWGGAMSHWSMVGENGPELVNGRTGQVIGAGRTQALLSGMGSGPTMAAPSVTNVVYLTVQGSVTTQQDLVTAVRNGLRRQQGRSSGPILAGVS